MRFLCHFGRMPPGRLTEPIFYFGQVGRGVGKPEKEVFVGIAFKVKKGLAGAKMFDCCSYK